MASLGSTVPVTVAVVRLTFVAAPVVAAGALLKAGLGRRPSELTQQLTPCRRRPEAEEAAVRQQYLPERARDNDDPGIPRTRVQSPASRSTAAFVGPLAAAAFSPL